jgi:bifunctional N-acetylglucosamine-1-phosphate-uridyltransferase/glucosamine-1-phosphate-acetyltransferase GlmU-like protein
MLHVIIPMAGEGKRFTEAGYGPKPFIDVCGRAMIQRVVDSISPSCEAKFLLLGQDVVGKTRGATDTILRGLASYDTPIQGPVLVSNCDLWLTKGVVNDFLYWAEGPDCSLITFQSTNPHHSYVKLDDECLVTEIKEKQVISDDAVAGVYWFKSGVLLEEYCRRVLDSGDTYNGEFYLSSVIAAMVADGRPVTTFQVGWEDLAMLGTPEELAVFEAKVAEGRIIL